MSVAGGGGERRLERDGVYIYIFVWRGGVKNETQQVLFICRVKGIFYGMFIFLSFFLWFLWRNRVRGGWVMRGDE